MVDSGSEFGMPSIEERFHKLFVIWGWRSCVQSGVLGYIQLSFVDISVLVSNGRE
jgi:hypothetical protein